VTTTAGERLAALLGEVTTHGSFSAKRTAPVNDLRIEVQGIGPLALPVPDAQARQLCKLGRPARYGQGEQTLTDPKVRDTWEIPKSRVKLDKRRWNRTLLPVLDDLREDLGLPLGCELKAELHSLLVYAPGQFFVPHQDTEKTDEMVGSLIVTLPSSFTGGALVVNHGGQTATYRSTKTSLSFVAFYADCRHELRPVKSGYRIVLTYNLMLLGQTAPAPADAGPPGTVDAAARCLDEHFTTPPPPHPWSASSPVAPPSRLVYLLDHEYTARSLSWSRLKGSDAMRVAVLREAAARTDCDVVLALADVHETWSCFEPEWSRSRYRRGRYGDWYDDDDDRDGDESGSTDGYELDELIESLVTLDCWIDQSGSPAEPIVTSISDAELCATTPSTDLTPYASEHEGYMGNYGNTMDHWYHRGALVLWPRRRAFAVRSEASPRWALDELSARVRAKDVAGAREMAATLAPFWDRVANQEQGRQFLTKALRVARALDDAALAAMVLKPFRVEMLARSHASALVAVVEGYGEGWARDLLTVWSGRAQVWTAGGRDRLVWVTSLPPLCEALHAAGGTGTSTARLLVQDSWRWASEAVEQRRSIMAPSRRDESLGELGGPVLAVLEGSSTIAATDLRDEALGLLCSDTDDLLPCLMAVLRAQRALPPARRDTVRLDPLLRHCAGRIEARLARPPRGDDDWSIELAGGCSCELCDVLGTFLADPARRTLEWPLAKERRRHVHSRIDGTELPVTHQTKRTGSPYKLVLTKTEALFEREKQARLRDQSDLAWLLGHRGPAAAS